MIDDEFVSDKQELLKLSALYFEESYLDCFQTEGNCPHICANMSISNIIGRACNRGPPCYLFPEAFQGCVILFPPQCQCWWIVSPSIATIATITQISNIVPKTEIKAVSLSPVTLISFAPLYHCITLMHIHKFGWNLKSSANSNLQKLSNVANQSSNMKIWKYTLSSKGRAIY